MRGSTSAPIGAHRNGGHPDPSPACVILRQICGHPLVGMFANQVQDDAGGGGVWGEGCRTAEPETTTSCLLKSQPSPTPTPPNSSTICPHIRGAGHTLQCLHELDGVGVGTAQLPKPLPPPEPLQGATGSCKARSMPLGGKVGVGASYLPPPFLHSG